MKTINGDLLEINEGVILHQVNCLGVTGGLAGALRRKWPEAFVPYLSVCNPERPAINLGLAQVGIAKEGLFIVHLFGQVNPGPNTRLEYVDYGLSALSATLKSEAYRGVPIYAPFKMGCGLGGGNWEEYSGLLEKHIPDIIIVRRPCD